MGVLACGRKGCDNVMCNYYSPEHGYICYPCRSELISLNGSVTISDFMKTPCVSESSTNPYFWESYIDRVFENRY